MTYDEGTVFNDKNVTQFLAELEEYISSLITFTAHKKAHPNAAIQAIPLEKIGMKEFERGPIAIDAPNSNDIMINEEVSAPEEERDVVNPKELYRKFQGMVDKNQISFSSNKYANNFLTQIVSLTKSTAEEETRKNKHSYLQHPLSLSL